MIALTSAIPHEEAGYALFSPTAQQTRPLTANVRTVSASDLREIRSVEPRVQPFAQPSSRVSSFASLPEDWDSYGAFRINLAAIERARQLFDTLYTMSLARTVAPLIPYHAAPSPDGGVLIEWRAERGAFELWISPDGRLSAVIDDPHSPGGAVEKHFLNEASAAAEIQTFAV